MGKRTHINGIPRTELGKSMRTEYEDGASINELAAEHGIGPRLTRNILLEHGTELRPRLSWRDDPALVEERNRLGKEFRELYEQGASIARISERSGRTMYYVYAVLREQGTQMRNLGRKQYSEGFS